MPSVLAILLLGSAGAVLWRREHAPPDTLSRDDVPVRLLQWAVGLLPADRVDWGQAMLGELDRIEGWPQRWRFALSCLGGLLVLRPRGGAGATAGALVAVALGGAALFGFAFLHYGLDTNPWNWVMVVILLVLLVGYILAGSALVRRPGVAAAGLAGGLVVLATWLAFSEFTFAGVLDPIPPVGEWAYLVSLIVVPVVVGAASTLRSGSALVGRRTARLAGVVASFGMFLFTTIAIVATHGGPPVQGQSVAYNVSDGLANLISLDLMLIPLGTATIGWAAATATFRIRRVDLTLRSDDSIGTPNAAGRTDEGNGSRTIGYLLFRAGVADGCHGSRHGSRTPLPSRVDEPLAVGQAVRRSRAEITWRIVARW